jgi:hypothetical protein
LFSGGGLGFGFRAFRNQPQLQIQRRQFGFLVSQFAESLEPARRIGQQVIELGTVAVELPAQILVMTGQVGVEVFRALEQPA